MALTHRRNLVHLLNPVTGEVLGALEHPESSGITSLSFTGDGTQLAVGGGFHDCFVWAPKRGCYTNHVHKVV